MVRNYVKSTNRGSFPPESLAAALLAVQTGSKVREAARQHGINHSTLLRYVKKSSITNNPIKPQKPGTKPVFTAEEEMKLVEHIVECANTFHGLSRKKTKELAYTYAVELNKTVPESWKQNQSAGVSN